jgi:hypothetical protein
MRYLNLHMYFFKRKFPVSGARDVVAFSKSLSRNAVLVPFFLFSYGLIMKNFHLVPTQRERFDFEVQGAIIYVYEIFMLF